MYMYMYVHIYCVSVFIYIIHVCYVYFFSSFLISSRPLSVSMGNAIKWLKFTIAKIQPNTPENEVR